MALTLLTNATLGNDVHTVDITNGKAMQIIISSETLTDPNCALNLGGVLSNRLRDQQYVTTDSLRQEIYRIEQAELETVKQNTLEPLNAVTITVSSSINEDPVITVWSYVGNTDQDAGIRACAFTEGLSVSGQPLGTECTGTSNLQADDVGYAICAYAPGSRTLQNWSAGWSAVADLETKNAFSSHAGASLAAAAGSDSVTCGWSGGGGSTYLMAVCGMYEIPTGPPPQVKTGYISDANSSNDVEDLFKHRVGDELKAPATGLIATNFDGTLPSDLDPAGPWDMSDLFVYKGSDAAQAVLAKMTALSTKERNAIISFVEGLEADGLWTSVRDVFALQLNSTDYLTGFVGIAGSLVPTGAPAHTPGVGVTYAQTDHYLTTTNSDVIFTTNQSGALAYVESYLAADDANPTQIMGALVGTVSVQARWDGTATPRMLLRWGATALTPIAPSAATREFGDVLGMGGSGTYFNWHMRAGGTISSVAKTAGTRPNVPFQFNGANNNGTPQNPRGCVHSLYLLVDKSSGLVSADIQNYRTRMRTFRDALRP